VAAMGIQGPGLLIHDQGSEWVTRKGTDQKPDFLRNASSTGAPSVMLPPRPRSPRPPERERSVPKPVGDGALKKPPVFVQECTVIRFTARDLSRAA
jgi:hypothetical protein